VTFFCPAGGKMEIPKSDGRAYHAYPLHYQTRLGTGTLMIFTVSVQFPEVKKTKIKDWFLFGS